MNPLLAPYFHKLLTPEEIPIVADHYVSIIDERLPQKFQYFYLTTAAMRADTTKTAKRKGLTLHRSFIKHITAAKVAALNGYYVFGSCVGNCGGGMSFSLTDIATTPNWPTLSAKRQFVAEPLTEPLHPKHPYALHINEDYPLTWYGVCYKCQDKRCDLCGQPFSVLTQRVRPFNIMRPSVCQQCYDLSFYHLQPIRPTRRELRSFAKQLHVERRHGKEA